MALDLYAGIAVSDYDRALAWYERLLGSPPTSVASATEAVWELAEHRSVFIEERFEHAGHAMHTIFVDDFDALVAQIAGRGLDPIERETYANGVRTETYRDPDGNEIGFGGAPTDPAGKR
ncbi:MAG: VOC family protein [Propionibacteriales bacterium]|nr:VOC family protein [Propionibacteriales bacterium]